MPRKTAKIWGIYSGPELFLTTNPNSMATPTAVGTCASGMINLVKSPDTSTWVLQLCTTRATQNESNAKFWIRMVPPMEKVLLSDVTYPCNCNSWPYAKTYSMSILTPGMVREYFHLDNGAFRRSLPTKGALWVDCRTQSVLFKKLGHISQIWKSRRSRRKNALLFLL